MIRVLYILHNRSLDGSLLTWITMAEYLISKGIEVCVVCEDSLFEFNEFNQFIRKYNIQTYTTYIQYSVREMPPIKLSKKIRWMWKMVTMLRRKLLFFIRLLKIAKKVKPDIIHTNTGVVHEGVFAAKMLNIPHIWHLREYQDLGCDYWIYPTKGIYTKILKLSYIITLTHDIKKHFNLDKYRRARVIPDGVYYKNEVVMKMPKKEYFLCVSRVHYQKNIEEAIYAFSKFYKTNDRYTLLIAGDGSKEYVNELKKLTETLGILTAVKFLGFCDRDKVKSLMQNSISLLVPSRYEGFGLMTAEGLFNGTIVIGKSEGGTLEIINDAGGFLYTGDYHDLAEKMNIVANLKDEEYLKIASFAQYKSQQQYSIERNGDEILGYYKEILSQ